MTPERFAQENSVTLIRVMKRTFSKFAVFLASGLLAAGCGSSGSDSPSKAEFTQHGATVCKQIQPRYESRIAELPKAQQEDLRKSASSVAAPTIREAAQEFDDLQAPSGDEQKVEAMVAALETAADEIEKNPNLVLGEPKGLAEFKKLSKAYGLDACAQL